MTFEIEEYRHENETEREWALRKRFIERYHDEFDHDHLLCLAQCYANIKTMGCKYSNTIMNQIKDLSSCLDQE